MVAGTAATMLPHRGFQPLSPGISTAVLAGTAQKGHSRRNLSGLREIRGQPPHWSIARDVFEIRPVP
jgi:hypothetical protein